MDATSPFVVKTLKEVGLSTKAILGVGLLAVGLYAYKTILDTRLVKLNIKIAERNLGELLEPDLKSKISGTLKKIQDDKYIRTIIPGSNNHQ